MFFLIILIPMTIVLVKLLQHVRSFIILISD